MQLSSQRMTHGCLWQVAQVAVQATATKQLERVIPVRVARPSQVIKAVLVRMEIPARTPMTVEEVAVAAAAILLELVGRPSMPTSPGGSAKAMAVIVAQTMSSPVQQVQPTRQQRQTQVKSLLRTRSRLQRLRILMQQVILDLARLTTSQMTQLQRSVALQLVDQRSSFK